MTTPPSKMSQALSQATFTQVSPTLTPAQVIDGPITRSRAKKLQQEVHALLCEIYFNISDVDAKLICKHKGLIPDSNVKACQPI